MGRTHTRVARAGGIIGGLTALQLAGAVPVAEASNFAGLNQPLSNCTLNRTGDPGRGDNKELAYFRSDLTAHISQAVVDHTNYVDSRRPYEGVWATEVGSITSTTDAAAYDQPYTNYCGLSWTPDGNQVPGGVFGLNTCITRNSAGECEKGEVRFTTRIGNLTDTAVKRQKLACHEMGHAFGLLHRDTNPQEGCMPRFVNTWTEARYSDHDKVHLKDHLS